jgi:hypothetical protein
MVLLNKMLFSNNHNYNYNTQNTQNSANISRAPVKLATLNAPMIDRVHKTKPGCSACGKKVA